MAPKVAKSERSDLRRRVHREPTTSHARALHLRRLSALQAVGSPQVIYTGGPTGLVASLVASVSGAISTVAGLISTLSRLATTGGGGFGRLIGVAFPLRLVLLGLMLAGFGVIARTSLRLAMRQP